MKGARAPLATDRHHFEWDGQPADEDGVHRCRRCGLPGRNRHHQDVPAIDRQLRLDIDG